MPRGHIAAIDRMARDHFRARLASWDIGFISPPAETADDVGFLKPECAKELDMRGQPDPHHANADDGARTVSKILSEMPVS